MTISAYDRHGSDEHSALSEEQLSEQIDAGDQAGEKAGDQAGDQIGAKSASSRKVASKKTATKKKAVQKSIAKKSSKKAGAKKAGTKNTGAKSTGAKNTGAKNTGTKAANVKASPKNARNLSADKLNAGKSVKKNAQAEDHLRAVLLLDGQIKALLQDQGGAGDKEAAKRRDAKVGSEATGLLWTLSALALAACGGGGGSGPAPVTGGSVQPRETEEPAPDAGGTPVGGDINTAGRPYLAGVLLGGDGTQPNKDVRDAAEAALSDKTDAPMPFSAILTDDLSTSGTFTVETAKIPSDKMISVAVGGIVDPLTGVQMKGGGVDAADKYQGPVWYSLQGSLLITPITDFIARKAALEAARDNISDINESSYYQDVINDLFADVLRDGDAGLTIADILDPKNYILPSSQDVDTLNQAQTSGSVLTDHLESVRIAKLVSEKALYIYGLQTDLYAPHNNAGLDDQKKAANTALQNLIDKARAIEAGKPVAVPKTDLSVDEAQSDGGSTYTFKLSDFGFRDLGGNADEENTPSQLASITITELPGRQDVPLRPNAAGEKVSALDITYDDFGTLYLIVEGEVVAVKAGDVINRADIEAGNLIFKPSKHFDRTASFKFSVNDGEQESDAVTLFIDINKQENSVYFYSPAIPDAQGTFKDEASEDNIAKQADAQPVEWVLQNGNPTDDWFAYQALADDPDTGDSFAGVTYALKGGLDDDASLFKIDEDSGKVTFITAPNFEKPHDVTTDGNVGQHPNNSYVFTVIATSPDGSTAEQTVTLTVQDRNDEVQQGKIGTETYLHLGAGDYLEVVDDDGSGWSSITGGAARTFESWVRINNKASDAKPTILFTYGSADEGVDPNGQEKQWFIIEVNADGQLQLNTNIGGDRKTFTASLSKNIADNAWYHVAVTYDGTAFKIWLDNEEVFSENIALDTTKDARLRLGDSTHLFSGDDTKNGSVDFDNFRVWKKALSPEEIIASSRIHKYGSTDLNDSKSGFLGVDGLALELSFDQLKSTSDAWDNSGNGHHARYGKLGVEQSDELASKITEQIKTHDDPAFAEKADKIAVVVENAHLILSNEMFEISDEDAKDSDADIYFHLAPVDGKLQVYDTDKQAWEDSGNNIFTLAKLKAGHVRFQHDGSENPNIEFQYSVYDGLEDGVGDDVLIGGDGDDTLIGGLARDLLIGGAGADELDGGTKIDTASYAGSDAGVRVNLHTGKGRGGHAQGDTLENIENLIGSDFDDVLTGADLVDNTFEGRGGADILDGRSDSSDKEGNSSLGGDIASYQTSDAGVMINLTNMKFARSVKNDGFSGSPITVQAGTDNYIIVTKAGALSAVADTAGQRDGNYVVLAGLNGDGDITWQRSFGGSEFFTSSGVVHTLAINPTDGGGQSLFRQGLSYTGIGGHADGDVLIDIEGVVGSAYADVLTGNAEDNKIKGGLGDDTLDGGAGFDLVGFEFAQQQDVRTDIITTTGSDPRSYNLSEDGIDIDGVVFVLGEDGSAAYYNGAEGDDTFMNFEGVTGSMFNDYLVGNSDVNDLHGSNGDDIVRGEGGNDNLFGGGGDDIVYGGAGDDMIYGGHSDDKLFGGTGADIIKADAGKDTLDGGADTVRDTLTGGAGDDIFVASAASGTVLAGADIVTDFTAGDKIQLQLTQTQRDAIDAITGDAAKLAELKKVIEIAAEDADGQSDTNDTVLTNKGMDGAVGGGDDTVLMVLEDYDTALTMDDFALEVL